MSVTYQCQCCGFERTFADDEEAFEVGWDAPPHFTQAVTCSACPSAFLVMGTPIPKGHRDRHEAWARDGHPETKGGTS